MRIRNFLRDLVLSGASGYFLDTPEAPAAGGVTPPASGSVTPPAGSPPPAATPPVAAAAPPATPTGFSYAEDRSRWIPPHRLTEESTKRQTLESELSTTRAQLQALTGVTPKDPATLKAEEVKTAFTQLFPHLTPLLSMSKEQIEALSKTPDVASRAISQEQRQWQRHGKQQLATIYTDVADAMNIEKLDADQQQDLKDTFTSWLKGKTTSELRASNGEESATLNRYEEGDPELLKEFVEFGSTRVSVRPLQGCLRGRHRRRRQQLESAEGHLQAEKVDYKGGKGHTFDRARRPQPVADVRRRGRRVRGCRCAAAHQRHGASAR
jgi:hypothetical protein